MRRRRRTGTGIAEAQKAIADANADLRATRARWPLIHTLTGKAEQVGDESNRQRQINHLGDLFATALREGGPQHG